LNWIETQPICPLAVAALFTNFTARALPAAYATEPVPEATFIADAPAACVAVMAVSAALFLSVATRLPVPGCAVTIWDLRLTTLHANGTIILAMSSDESKKLANR
jgi:hypothetical protein